jgi:cytoskeleton protein RodZ
MGAVNLARELPIQNREEIVPETFREIGQILAQARKEQNLTIKQVASKIHIRQRYLIDIEEGLLSDLPGRVYILGFIRTYARLLNLDGEELIRRVSMIPHLSQKDQGHLPSPVLTEEEPSYLVLGLSAVLIIGVVIGGYFFLRPSSQESPPLAGVSEPPPNHVHEEKSSQPEITPEDKTELAESKVAVDLPKEHASLTQAKIIYPKEMLTAIPETQEPNVKAQEVSSESKKIVLRAKEPSWVEVRDENGRVIFMRVLRNGQEYNVPQNPGVTISTGNAGGIEIFVGDQKLPSLGTRGEVRRGLSVETLLK